MQHLKELVSAEMPLTLSGVPGGYDAMLLATLAESAFAEAKQAVLHVASDDGRMAALRHAVRFFAPRLEVIEFPAWDCLPYDRVSPQGDIVAKRMAALSRLTNRRLKTPLLVITTVNAVLQRVPSPDAVAGATFHAEPGDTVDMVNLTEFLASNGYTRSGQVMEPGEFAVRGGLLDIFPPGEESPLRLDFFGDELDTIRRFDPLDQRTIGKAPRLHLKPASEFSLSAKGIERFRRNYVNTFGPAKGDDLLYEAVSEGRKYQGAEHWLPFFHEEMATLFDYLDAPVFTLDHQVEDAAAERFKAVDDYYAARKEAWDIARTNKSITTPPYKPIPSGLLYLGADEWENEQGERNARRLTPFEEPPAINVLSFGARQGRDFGPERNNREVNVYDAVRDHVKSLRAAGKRVVFASYSAGAADRLKGVLEDHGLMPVGLAETWEDIRRENKTSIAVTVLPLERGFETGDLAVISEQDVLGDRLVRKARRSKRADNFLKEASALAPGDMVVHASHGIGRFEGLETVTVSGAAHDCLLVIYHGGDKLFVPVENIEVLSRFGGEDAGAQLDKLGGVAWQARKAKAKERIREMAGQLIKLAAARALREGQRIAPPEGIYDEFAAASPIRRQTTSSAPLAK